MQHLERSAFGSVTVGRARLSLGPVTTGRSARSTGETISAAGLTYLLVVLAALVVSAGHGQNTDTTGEGDVGGALPEPAVLPGETGQTVGDLARQSSAAREADAVRPPDAEKRRGESEIAEVQRLETQLLLERGVNRCRRGDFERGLLYLARALEHAPPDQLRLQKSIRTLLDGWLPTIHPLTHVLMLDTPVQALRVAADGHTIVLVTVRREGRQYHVMVHRWNPASDQHTTMDLPPLKGYGKMALNQDGSRLLIGTRQGHIQLWDTVTAEMTGAPMVYKSHVGAVTFSPDGESIIAGFDDGSVRVWDPETGQPRGEPLQHEKRILSLAMSPDGNTVAAGSYRKVLLWTPGTAKTLELTAPGAVSSLAFSPDGAKLAAGCSRGGVHVWDLSSREAAAKSLPHVRTAVSLQFSNDGKQILSAMSVRSFTAGVFNEHRGEALLWDLSSESPLGAAMQHQDGVRMVLIHPDGQSPDHRQRRRHRPRLATRR